MDVHIERTRVGETEASNCRLQLNISLKWRERDMVISPLMTRWERKVLLRLHWATSECFVPIFHLSQHKVEQHQTISHANLKSCFDYDWVKNMFFWYFQSHVICSILVLSRTRTMNVEWSPPSAFFYRQFTQQSQQLSQFQLSNPHLFDPLNELLDTTFSVGGVRTRKCPPLLSPLPHPS